MHYFQFNIGDYARSTLHLSLMEDLAYRRLLDMYYDTESPIPLETQWVARRIRMETEVVESVLNDMFKRTDDGFRHARCDVEIAEYQVLRERNRANGKRGGRPKTVKNQEQQNPVGFQSQPSGNPKHKTETINQDKVICASSDALPAEPVLELEGEQDNGDQITVQDVVEYWNEVADRIGKPRVQRVSDGRKQLVRARIKQNTIDDFMQVFTNIERSDFLRNWKAMGFDWVFKAGNFQKILEGNYND